VQKTAIKDLLYGGISELMKNKSYYYRSTVGKAYSHFTDEGKAALNEFVLEISQFMTEADEAELDRRAKEIVMNTLKGKE